MKHVWRKLAAICLAAALFVTLLPGITAEAATKNITLYVGEQIYFTDYRDVAKVSSSNSKVVKAVKDKENKKNTNLTAKKAGKATVTIKTSGGTTKLNITVKKLNFSVKALSVAGGYVLLSVKNNTAQTFDKIALGYTFKDAQGQVVKQDSELVNRVIAKKTVYVSIYVGSSQAGLLDLASCSAKVTQVSHEPSYVYKDVSSKVKASVKDEKDEGNKITFSVTTKNTTNQSVSGYNYIMIYDAGDALIGVEKRSFYLDKKAANTSTSGYISKYTYPTYDHYKIVTQAYYTARNKNW